MSKPSNTWLGFLAHLSREVWLLCRLRGNPANIPHSVFLLVLVACMNVGIALVDLLQRVQAMQLITQSGIALITQMVAVSLILLSVKKLSRFVQTATALFSTGVVLSAFHLTLITVAQLLPPGGMSVILVCTMILLVWSLLITAHILRCAMEVAFTFTLFIAIGLVILSNIIVNLATGVT